MLMRVFRLLARLPLRALHALGAALGWVAYATSARYRRMLRANLGLALPGNQRVLRRAIGEAGRQVLEVAWVWSAPASAIQERVRIEGAAELEALLRQDRAVVMLTPHLGCFEVIAQHHMTGSLGATRPMLALYRVPRKAALRPLFEQARQRFGLRLAPADLQGVRRMLRALRERQIVGLLPDQVPSRGEGVWAPFFGRPAFTMTLPARLARGHDATLVALFAQRLPLGAGFRIVWKDLTGLLRGEPLADATALNAAMEEMILRCPEQYLWAYNRYKRPAGVEPPPVLPAGPA